MNEINRLRQDIEKLHEDLLKIILKRKNFVDQIWELKRQGQMDMMDLNREQALIEQFDHIPELKNDLALKNFYHNVVKNIIFESKKYAKKV